VPAIGHAVPQAVRVEARTGYGGMAHLQRATWPLLLASVLASCSLQPATVERASPPPVAPAVPANDVPANDVPASAETPPATMGCDPAPVQSLLGQVATPALQSRARADAGAEDLRVLAPGQAASKEYRAGRLNLQLDAGDRLIRAYCG
jgi:hypothetical protein